MTDFHKELLDYLLDDGGSILKSDLAHLFTLSDSLEWKSKVRILRNAYYGESGSFDSAETRFNKFISPVLKKYKEKCPDVMTKSGLMLGIGETKEEVIQVMQDMRDHDIDMITLGQYLQPSKHHLAVERFVHPDEFDELGELAKQMGFKRVASGPMVRSSYHADQQMKGEPLLK